MEASDLFQMIHRGGFVEKAEVYEALISTKPRLLWRSLRHFLLALRFRGLPEAFDALRNESGEHKHKASEDEDFQNHELLDFCTKLSESWGIDEEDAANYFQLLETQNGTSEDCVESLRALLCSAVPPTSLEDFWHRVAAEWPEVLEAARSKTKRCNSETLGDRLLELLPKMPFLRTSHPSPPSGASGAKRPRSSRRDSRGAQSESSEFHLLSLDLKAFKALAVQIDVSQEDAESLFESITRSSGVPQTLEEDMISREKSHSLESVIYLEDFAEQLTLWTEGFDQRKDKVRHLVAPARAAISAFKAELLPAEPTETEAEQDEKSVSVKLPKLKRPKLPWCTHYHLRPNPIPPALS